MNITFESVLIGVKSIEKAKPFYESVFGITFDEVRPPFSCFTMNGIEFDVEENSSERSPDWEKNYIGTLKPFSFKVDSVDDFLVLVTTHGGTIAQEPSVKPWGWKEAKFTDLDGNIFLVEEEV
jgi:predicted enzyme related to lactoylglutathione lyase